MKIKRKLFVFCIFLALLALFRFFRPTIVIHSAENSFIFLEHIMDVYDKYSVDGEMSDWYVMYIQKYGGTFMRIEADKKKAIRFPLLYDRRGSQNLIICYQVGNKDTEIFGKTLMRVPQQSFMVNARELYFFRIHFFIDDSGKISQSFIQKYPWSKRKDFVIPDAYSIGTPD